MVFYAPLVPTSSSSDIPNYVVPTSYLTGDIPGTGGLIKQRHEDFLVEEIPAYDPCGSGEHIYLMVQKAGLSTLQMVSIIARHFRVRESAVGFAGLKDKHAITRQQISVHVPGKKPEDFPSLQHQKLVILGATLHNNKLRRGHLRGNRFVIKIRSVSALKVIAAKKVLERLESHGVPNRLGEQRFGHAGNNHLVGRAILMQQWEEVCDQLISPPGDARTEHALSRELYAKKDYAGALRTLPAGAETEARVLNALARAGSGTDGGFDRAAAAISDMARTFYVTSFQSAVFNAVLEERIATGRLATLEPGDVAFKHDNASVFDVEAALAADPETLRRLAAVEISSSGPMWGVHMKPAQGEIGAFELKTLLATGVTPKMLAAFAERVSDGAPGKRRSLRVPLHYPQVEGGADEFGHYIKCSFELPAGSFATVVVREIIKPAPGVAMEDPHGRHRPHAEGAATDAPAGSDGGAGSSGSDHEDASGESEGFGGEV